MEARTPSDDELLRLSEAAADLGAPDRGQLTAQLKAHADEVERTLGRFLDDDPEAALRLAAALPMLWQDLGRLDDGRSYTEQAIARWSGPQTPALAMAFVAAAELAFRQGDQAAAVDRCERAIAAAEAGGAPAVAAIAHVNLARVAFRAGDAAEIERQAKRALELADSDAGARRGGLHMLGWAAYAAGDIPLAMRRFEESLAFRRSLGDRFAVTVEIANLADLAAEQGDVADAAARLREALLTARDLESTYLVVNLLPSIAALAAARGDWISAATLLGATDALSAATGLSPDPGAWQSTIEAAAAEHGAAFDGARSSGRDLGQDAAFDAALEIVGRLATEHLP